MLQSQSRALKTPIITLFSNKLKLKIVHWVGAQGQVNMAKREKQVLIVTSLTKKKTNQKNFFLI